MACCIAFGVVIGFAMRFTKRIINRLKRDKSTDPLEWRPETPASK